MIPEIVNVELNLFMTDCARTGKIPGVPFDKLGDILPCSATDYVSGTEKDEPVRIMLVEYDRSKGIVTFHTRTQRIEISNFESVNAGFGKYEIVSYATSMFNRVWSKEGL